MLTVFFIILLVVSIIGCCWFSDRPRVAGFCYFLILVSIIGLNLAFAYDISTSDLPFWMKFWLLSK